MCGSQKPSEDWIYVEYYLSCQMQLCIIIIIIIIISYARTQFSWGASVLQSCLENMINQSHKLFLIHHHLSQLASVDTNHSWQFSPMTVFSKDYPKHNWNCFLGLSFTSRVICATFFRFCTCKSALIHYSSWSAVVFHYLSSYLVCPVYFLRWNSYVVFVLQCILTSETSFDHFS